MSESGDGGGSAASFKLMIPLLIFAFVVLGGLLIVSGYPGYLSDLGNQQACESEFGPNSTFVGTTGDRDGALCKTDGEIGLVKSQDAPMNEETWSKYLDRVYQGEE